MQNGCEFKRKMTDPIPDHPSSICSLRAPHPASKIGKVVKPFIYSLRPLSAILGNSVFSMMSFTDPWAQPRRYYASVTRSIIAVIFVDMSLSGHSSGFRSLLVTKSRKIRQSPLYRHKGRQEILVTIRFLRSQSGNYLTVSFGCHTLPGKS